MSCLVLQMLLAARMNKHLDLVELHNPQPYTIAQAQDFDHTITGRVVEVVGCVENQQKIRDLAAISEVGPNLWVGMCCTQVISTPHTSYRQVRYICRSIPDSCVKPRMIITSPSQYLPQTTVSGGISIEYPVFTREYVAPRRIFPINDSRDPRGIERCTHV